MIFVLTMTVSCVRSNFQKFCGCFLSGCVHVYKIKKISQKIILHMFKNLLLPIFFQKESFSHLNLTTIIIRCGATFLEILSSVTYG